MACVAAPNRLDTLYGEPKGGVAMMRLFAVWNRSYKKCIVVANDIQEALQLCESGKHLRRASLYRKFEDITDASLAEGADDAVGLQKILDGDKTGCVKMGDDKLWAFV